MDNKQVAERLIRLARSLVSVQTPVTKKLNDLIKEVSKRKEKEVEKAKKIPDLNEEYLKTLEVIKWLVEIRDILNIAKNKTWQIEKKLRD